MLITPLVNNRVGTNSEQVICIRVYLLFQSSSVQRFTSFYINLEINSGDCVHLVEDKGLTYRSKARCGE